eukprot:756746-Hanusia_phi.AAC.1
MTPALQSRRGHWPDSIANHGGDLGDVGEKISSYKRRRQAAGSAAGCLLGGQAHPPAGFLPLQLLQRETRTLSRQCYTSESGVVS